ARSQTRARSARATICNAHRCEPEKDQRPRYGQPLGLVLDRALDFLFVAFGARSRLRARLRGRARSRASARDESWAEILAPGRCAGGRRQTPAGLATQKRRQPPPLRTEGVSKVDQGVCYDLTAHFLT